MLRTIELFWFGLGFIGVLLAGSIVARRYPEEWHRRNGYGSIHVAIALSFAGPLMLLPALSMVLNPMAMAMLLDMLMSERRESLTTADHAKMWLVPIAVVLFLAYTLVVQPMQSHAW